MPSRPALAAVLSVLPALAMAGHELDDRDIARGAAVYFETCSACHGAELQGQPDWQRPGPDGILPAPPHDHTGHTWHHDNRLLFDYVSLGGHEALDRRGVAGFRSGMPAMGDVLSDDDIWNVLAYIRSTWPAPVRAEHDLRNPLHD